MAAHPIVTVKRRRGIKALKEGRPKTKIAAREQIPGGRFGAGKPGTRSTATTGSWIGSRTRQKVRSWSQKTRSSMTRGISFRPATPVRRRYCGCFSRQVFRNGKGQSGRAFQETPEPRSPSLGTNSGACLGAYPIPRDVKVSEHAAERFLERFLELREFTATQLA